MRNFIWRQSLCQKRPNSTILILYQAVVPKPNFSSIRRLLIFGLLRKTRGTLISEIGYVSNFRGRNKLQFFILKSQVLRFVLLWCSRTLVKTGNDNKRLFTFPLHECCLDEWVNNEIWFMKYWNVNQIKPFVALNQ